jgi:hypothetical protein
MCYSVIYKDTVSETPEELIKNLELEKSELVINDSYSEEITMDSCLCQINIHDTLSPKYNTRLSDDYFDFIVEDVNDE